MKYNINLSEYLKEMAGNPNRTLYSDSMYYRKNKMPVSLKAPKRKYIPDSTKEANK